MTIQLGNCLDNKKKIKKSFTARMELTGHIKEPSSIIDPVILIEADLGSLSGFNYCYIPIFRRYYYITNMKTATNDTCTISCHVDVLMSFSDQILGCSGYVDRQEDEVSVLISDSDKVKQINPAISTIPFSTPANATGYTYCLITTRSV